MRSRTTRPTGSSTSWRALVGFQAATAYAGVAIPPYAPGEDDDFAQAVRIIRSCMSPDVQIGAAEEAARRTRRLVGEPFFRRLTLFLALMLDARGEMDPDEVDPRSWPPLRTSSRGGKHEPRC
jgi:hypothetical protein